MKSIFKFIIGALMCIPIVCFSKNLVIGDSHAGGIKTYCSNAPEVLYKNGSTTRYWLNKPVYYNNINKLYIVTGTNDYYGGTRKNQKAICNKWKAKECIYVDIPNYPKYDGTHLYASGYRKLCKNIFR